MVHTISMPKVPTGKVGKDGRVGLTVRLPPVLYQAIRDRSVLNDRSITAEAVHLLKAAVQYEEVMIRPAQSPATPLGAKAGQPVNADKDLF